MHRPRSFCFLSVAALASVLAMFLMPLPAALAGGCCGVATITSLATGQELVARRGQTTLGYNLTTFDSFTDFRLRGTAPARSGPAYEVDRDGWDHLLYYPGVGAAPGVVYYEGLYTGSSEYDHQWFVVPADQDAALQLVLAAKGLTAGQTAGTPQRQWTRVLLVFALFATALLAVYQALGAYVRRPAPRATI
jgi:hypothetical protein